MTGPRNERQTIDVGTDHRVSALFDRPDAARALFVLAHGAGAGMAHPSMQALAEGLSDSRIASLRYQFPYMERGQRRPDPPALCHATVRAAIAAAARLAPDLPLIAGGRSFGGRMTSQAQSLLPLPQVRGLVFLAFPLHPAGKPGSDRAMHLRRIAIPMLFIQGTRDELAQRSLLGPVVDGLGTRAKLHLLDDADHAFHVPARSGRNDAEVREEALDALRQWMDALAIGS
jgi:predicted alpha/beta-hydrolase family hydrolase